MKWELRALIIRRGCPMCLEWKKIINKINSRLPVGKQFKVIDDYNWHEFKMQDNQLSKVFEKEGFVQYPFCYLSGNIIEPANSILLEATLNGLIGHEYII